MLYDAARSKVSALPMPQKVMIASNLHQSPLLYRGLIVDHKV